MKLLSDNHFNSIEANAHASTHWGQVCALIMSWSGSKFTIILISEFSKPSYLPWELNLRFPKTYLSIFWASSGWYNFWTSPNPFIYIPENGGIGQRNFGFRPSEAEVLHILVCPYMVYAHIWSQFNCLITFYRKQMDA